MKLLLIIAVCASLLGTGVAESREIKFHQQFSGGGWQTGVNTDGDTSVALAFTTEHRGTFGRATGIGRVEYTDFMFGDCPDNLPTSHLVQHSVVHTFSDLSMLYLVATDGRLCFNPLTSEVTCEEEGVFVGGTGRFEGATGSWAMECQIDSFETSNAVTGTIKATVNLPSGRDD